MNRAARFGLGLGVGLGAGLTGTACSGERGTLTVAVVTAPGADVLADVARVRLVLSAPYTVVEADRDGAGGFDLALDVPANGPSGELHLEALDADGELIAYGRTPPVPIAAVNAEIAIYVAAPRSFAAAPVALTAPRTAIAVTSLTFGTVLAGGRDADGTATTDVEIYSAYDHDLQQVQDLPGARADAAIATGGTGFVYLFGGTDETGAARGSLWRLAPADGEVGRWIDGGEDTSLARLGASIAPLGADAFLVTGAPPLVVDGLSLDLVPFSTPEELDGEAASLQRTDLAGAPVYTLVIGDGAGTTGVVRLGDGQIVDEADVPADALRTGHRAVAAGLEIFVVGGAGPDGVPLTSLLRFDPEARRYESVPDLLATGRTDVAVAVTDGVLVVAGGRDADGAVLGDAELFDIETLEPLGTIPLITRRASAEARTLPNHQVLLVGGVDGDGGPLDSIELFTPDPATP